MHSNFNKNLISDQLADETNSSLISLLKKTIENTGSQTKRDFELVTSKQKKREIEARLPRWLREAAREGNPEEIERKEERKDRGE